MDHEWSYARQAEWLYALVFATLRVLKRTNEPHEPTFALAGDSLS